MKTVGLTYVLWFFLGLFGVHKFYLGKTGMGLLYLIMGVIGLSTTFIVVGFFILAAEGILLLIDLFTIPSQVESANERSAVQIAEFNKKVAEASKQ